MNHNQRPQSDYKTADFRSADPKADGASRRPAPAARKGVLRSALTAALAVAAGPLAASARPAPGQAPASPPPKATPVPRKPAAPTVVGLDSLSDEQVMTELSSLKLNSLLGRLFEADHVTKEQQDSIESLGALREMEGTKALGNNRRIELMRKAVEGLNALLPKMHDPMGLMNYTGVLVTKGIEPDINTLEYWGDNPVIQARLRPAADVISRMLKQVSADAEAQANALAATLRNNDPRAAQWDAMDGLKDAAKYYEAIMAYYRVVSIDTSGGTNKAAVKERADIADAAIKFLADPYDKPTSENEGKVQPLVHNRIGKLYMAKGDYAKAKDYFDAEILGKTPDNKPIEPKPDTGQVYEARYFTTVCDVLAKKPDVAEADLNKLVEFQKASLPKEAQSGVEAASEMLRYRMLSAKADLAKDAKQKDELNKQADAVLTALGEKHPEFQGIITEQLVNRLPDNVNLAQQGVPVLQALISKGLAERLKPENVPLDDKVVNRAVEAARVLSARQGTGLPPQTIQETALFVPALLDRQHKDVDAANAYLKFAKDYPGNSSAGPALDRAVTLAFNQIHGSGKDTKDVKALYGDALAAAVNPPWSRKELAFFYAEYLRTHDRPHEAITWYRAVPKGSKQEFSARFLELKCISDEMDDPKLPAAARAKDTTDAGPLVDEVRQLGAAAEQNKMNQFRLAYTTMLGAHLAVQQKQPQRALQLLENFEANSKDLGADDAGMVQEAVNFRAQAYIAMGQLNKATDQVVALSKTSPEAASRLASSLMNALDKDYKRFEANSQTQDMAETALNMSKLTNFMVQFCQSNPKLQAMVADYQMYDALIKRRAGTLLADPEKKKAALAEALASYEALKKTKPDDTNVLYGIAMTQYEQQDWAGAANGLGLLLRGGKLGGPQLIQSDNVTGDSNVKDNDVYWEAMYKWLRSNAELAKASPNNPQTKEALASAKSTVINLFTQYGGATGGTQWAGQFTDLRKSLAPDFDPNALPKAPTTGPSKAPVAPGSPATQPVAAGPSR